MTAPDGVAPLSAVIVDTDTAEWQVWSTTARLVVTDPDQLGAAYGLAVSVLEDVDLAASRFRDDSQIRRLDTAGGRPTTVGWLLADLVTVALDAARHTDGDVDPCLGNGMRRIGYDRDFALLPSGPSAFRLPVPTAPDAPRRTVSLGGAVVTTAKGWRDIVVDGDRVSVPAGLSLDLGATAKAFSSDLIARTIADDLGIGVLVSLGGDIATAGSGPDGGWRILVSDGPAEPQTSIALPAGSAVATSSTIRRRWDHDGLQVHHILDPRTGNSAAPVWRTVTVAAPTCVLANTLSTAAVVRGAAAIGWLRGQNLPARLVAADGSVTLLCGWPSDTVQSPLD